MIFDIRKARLKCELVGNPFCAVDDVDLIEAMTMFRAALDRIDELEAMSPEHPDFMEDWRKVQKGEAIDGKKWLDAYRKAQNSNVIRRQMMDALEETIAVLQKRIVDMGTDLALQDRGIL